MLYITPCNGLWAQLRLSLIPFYDRKNILIFEISFHQIFKYFFVYPPWVKEDVHEELIYSYQQLLFWKFHRKWRSIQFYIKFIDKGRLSGKKRSIHEALFIFCGSQRSIAWFRQTIGAKFIIKVHEILGNQFYYFQ